MRKLEIFLVFLAIGKFSLTEFELNLPDPD